METASLQEMVVRKGVEIFRLMEGKSSELFDSRQWAGKLLELAMADPALKVQLFRFIDVLPALTTPELVAQHMREYFLPEEAHAPEFFRTLVAGASTGMAAGITASLVRKNIQGMARVFIAGDSPADALKPLRKLWDAGRSFTVDILGEAALSDKEARRYIGQYLALAGFLAAEIGGWPTRHPERERLFPRLNISVKVSSLYSRVGPLNHEDSVAQLKERLRPVFRKVREAEGFVNLDMEMHSLKNITLDVFTELLDEEEFRGWQGAGIALQAYLKETAADLDRLIDWGRVNGQRITVRLVKGAYWEYENVLARLNGWPVPVFPDKSGTDGQFERCVERLFAGSPHVIPAFATHNVRSLAFTMVLAEQLGVPPDAYEFQMLFGMAGPVKEALARMGFPVREYVPVGALIPGMAYLVRRLLENTSNEGFLRKAFVENVAPEALLAKPLPPAGETSGERRAGGAFVNEPFLDFSGKNQRAACRAALEKVRGELGRFYPAIIGGREHDTAGRIASVNPARPEEVVGTVAAISREMAEDAVAVACAAQKEWGGRSPRERAEVLFGAAEIMRGKRHELLAWQVFEVGKNWAEADADVAEAIDYLEYYGREALRLGDTRRLGELPGEDNRYSYLPLGVGVVIAPWNFPLAISTGMVAASLVTGNAVVYKPSSFSPVNGWQLFSTLMEAGVPDGVLNFVPFPGDLVGNALVGHPEVGFLAFTGSREVGLSIIEQGGHAVPGQSGIKRVIVEMGGKNAIIVDADADLDQAVAGVMQSAFGYQGQKCSACSRVIVLSSCYGLFLERLGEAVRDIVVGAPEDPACFMGPVISPSAREKILSYIEIGRGEGTIVAQGMAPAEGWYVPPTLVADLPPGSRLLREEIFGPVLAAVRAKDMDEALSIANDSEYALTGGVFSRSPATIQKARAGFSVGNLYINRAITGAAVGRQPFGGFRLSGGGAKAGGPDYLLQFVKPLVVTENTMRRGFTPEVLS